jgi:hypothetical protein
MKESFGATKQLLASYEGSWCIDLICEKTNEYLRTAGNTWTDCKTNTQIANELEITPILDKLLEYKRNWIL